MPINSRPRDLTDVLARLYSPSSPQSSPGALVHPVILTRGGITTLGLSATPSIVRATTWIAVGLGNTVFNANLGNPPVPPTVSDTILTNETGRAQVLPPLLGAGTAIALALLSPIAGNGLIWEIGLFGPGSHGSPTNQRGTGTLYVHVALPVPVLKNAGKQITIEWSEG